MQPIQGTKLKAKISSVFILIKSSTKLTNDGGCDIPFAEFM